MILATVGQVITQAQAEYEAKYGRRKAAEETATSETPPASTSEGITGVSEGAAVSQAAHAA